MLRPPSMMGPPSLLPRGMRLGSGALAHTPMRPVPRDLANQTHRPRHLECGEDRADQNQYGKPMRPLSSQLSKVKR